MSLEITSIDINKTSKSGGKIVAFANITFNDEFCVKGIKVINGSKGLFIGMPSNLNKKDGKYYDIAFPVNKEARSKLTKAILDAYEDADESPFDE